MARSATSPSVRIKLLETALVKAKKLKRGTTLTARPMAELVAASWPTLRDWCNDLPGFDDGKCFERGANGIEYAFKPIPTIRFLLKHFQAERAASVKQSKRVRQAIGGTALDDAPDDMSLADIARMVAVARSLREERQQQNQLVDVAVVDGAVRRMMTDMQQAAMKAAREQDPTGQFAPDVAEKFDNALTSIVLRMERAGNDCLNAIRGAAT